jgi:hypothetical protein
MALALLLVLAACSFDYGASGGDSENEPDVIMKDVEYVRMENALPLVRMRSREARRYEKKHAMEMDDFSFEQYNAPSSETGEIPDVNVRGRGASVKIETDSRNLSMAGGVSLDVESENFSLQTESLSWEDEERLLSAPGEVAITRSDGTRLSGRNLSADTRRRSWRFEGEVSGDIVEEDDEETENGDESAESAGEPVREKDAAKDGEGADDTSESAKSREEFRRVEK